METPLLIDGSDLADLPYMAGEYQRRRRHETVLYQVVQENDLTFVRLREEEGRPLPRFVRREFEKYLSCGQILEGFARVRCGACGYDRLVAFSCKGKSLCPSCLGRRMSDGAAFLVDHGLGDTPIRHWVLSLPPPLRFLLAYDSKLLSEVLSAFLHSVIRYLRWKAKGLLGLTSVSVARPGAVTAIQRCSSSIGLDVDFHSMVSDGVFVRNETGVPMFHKLPAPTDVEVTDVAWETCRRTRRVLIRLCLWSDDNDGTTASLLEDLPNTSPPGLADIHAASIRGVLSLGPRRGQRVVRFFGQAARDQGDDRGILACSGLRGSLRPT